MSMTREQFIKKFDPVARTRCDECGTRMGTKKSPRRRIVTMQTFEGPDGRMMDMGVHQLCNPCAENLLAEKLHLLPNIAKEVGQARKLYLAPCLGGVQ